MESLALLVAVILSIAVVGGPLSLFFSFLYERNNRKSFNRNNLRTRLYLSLAILLAAPAVLVGIRLLALEIALGGKFFGALGVLTGSISIYRVFRKSIPSS